MKKALEIKRHILLYKYVFQNIFASININKEFILKMLS